MSQYQEIPATQCSSCNRVVQYSPVKSQANGNRGRFLAKCLQINHNTGKKCNFWHWLPNSRTPSLSPNLSSNKLSTTTQSARPPFPSSVPLALGPSNGITFPFVPSTLAEESVPAQLLSSIPSIPMIPSIVPIERCRTVGCNSTRLRKGCTQRRCKLHCREAGPCADPAHRVSDAVLSRQLPPPPAFSTVTKSLGAMAQAQAATMTTDAVSSGALPPPTFSITTNSFGAFGRVQAPTIGESPFDLRTWAKTPPPPSNPLPAYVEPLFASHITPIFSDQMVLEEKMREQVRHREATRLESKRKVQQTVFVYAWMEDDVAPAPFEVQEGFVWPHFVLNAAVLSLAGFTAISPEMRFQLFHFNLGHWTMVKTNHVFDLNLKDTPRVFIKAINVQRCQDFSQFLHCSSSSTSPNIRTKLAAERASVQQKMVDFELSPAPTAPFLRNKHKLSPSSPPSTPKRPRFLSDSPIRGTYRPPIPVPKITRKVAPGATRVVKKKNVSERELMEMYESDSGLEFDDPFPFGITTAPSASTSSLIASSSTASSSTSATSTFTPFANLGITVKQEDLTSDLPFHGPHSKVLKWPVDFYAIDIVQCFDETKDSATDAMNCSIFEHHFGEWVPYRKSTFCEHRQRWKSASLDDKDAVLSAGRTKAGQWINLMSTTPAPRSHIKAARKHQSKQVMSIVDPEVIEITSD